MRERASFRIRIGQRAKSVRARVAHEITSAYAAAAASVRICFSLTAILNILGREQFLLGQQVKGAEIVST